MQYEHPLDSIPAYVLGALDADEALRVRDHLAACDTCRAEAESFHQVVGVLPYAAPAAVPPERVKRQLFARIAATQEPRTASAPPPRPASPRPAPRNLLPRLAAAGAVALAIGLGWLTLDARQQVARVEQQLAQSSSTVAALEERVRQGDAQAAALEERVRQRDAQVAALEERVRQGDAQVATLEDQVRADDQIVAFIASPETVTRTIAATQRAGDASAQMYMQPGHNQVVLVVEGLPPPPAGQVYRLWLADESGQVAVGTIEDQAGGATRLLEQAPRPMETYDQVMVTIEPAGGAQGPSQNVLFETNL